MTSSCNRSILIIDMHADAFLIISKFGAWFKKCNKKAVMF
ncbi:Uncharacterised protein r2_g4163 [Pycnogonum litorale]